MATPIKTLPKKKVSPSQKLWLHQVKLLREKEKGKKIIQKAHWTDSQKKRKREREKKKALLQ